MTSGIIQTKPGIVTNMAILFFLSLLNPAPSVFAKEEHKIGARHVVYRYTLRNRSGQHAPQVEFRCYAPIERTDRQQRIKLNVSHPYDLLSDELGNQIIRLTFHNVPPYATIRVIVHADVRFFGQPQENRGDDGNNSPALTSTALQEKGESDPHQCFLRPEPYCESDDPDILRLAQQLTSPNPAQTAERIFQWVAEQMTYSGYLSQPHGAKYALQHRQGDCTEYMYLFVALCRAAGIPARGLGGYVLGSGQNILRPETYHNWAECFFDDRWQLADPQRKIFRQADTLYLAMRIIGEDSNSPIHDFRRFRVTGGNITVTMHK